MGNSYADYRDEVGLKIKYYRLKKGYTQDQWPNESVLKEII